MCGSQRCAWLARCGRMLGASISLDKQYNMQTRASGHFITFPPFRRRVSHSSQSKVLLVFDLLYAYTAVGPDCCARTLDEPKILFAPRAAAYT